MYEGFVRYPSKKTISKDEHDALIKIKTKYNDLLAAIKKLQRYKVGSIDRHPSDRHPTPTMLPCHDGEFIRFSNLTDLTLSDEEIFKRNEISKIDNEIKRLIAEREKLSNGK